MLTGLEDVAREGYSSGKPCMVCFQCGIQISRNGWKIAFPRNRAAKIAGRGGTQISLGARRSRTSTSGSFCWGMIWYDSTHSVLLYPVTLALIHSICSAWAVSLEQLFCACKPATILLLCGNRCKTWSMIHTVIIRSARAHVQTRTKAGGLHDPLG